MGRAEDHHTARTEIGAKVDQTPDMLPASRAQCRVRCGDVQALGADHQPVQPDEAQTFGFNDGPVLAPLRCRDRGRIFGQCERSDLNACVARFSNGAASVHESEFLKCFVTNRVIKPVAHVKTIQCTGFSKLNYLRATRISERPRHGSTGSMRRQIHTVLSKTFSANLLMCEVPSTRL